MSGTKTQMTRQVEGECEELSPSASLPVPSLADDDGSRFHAVGGEPAGLLLKAGSISHAGPSRGSLVFGAALGTVFGISAYAAGFRAGAFIIAFALSSLLISILLPDPLFFRFSRVLDRLARLTGRLMAILTLAPVFFLVFVPLRIFRGVGGVLERKRDDSEASTLLGQQRPGTRAEGHQKSRQLPTISYGPNSQADTYWHTRKGGWSDLKRPFG